MLTFIGAVLDQQHVDRLVQGLQVVPAAEGRRGLMQSVPALAARHLLVPRLVPTRIIAKTSTTATPGAAAASATLPLVAWLRAVAPLQGSATAAIPPVATVGGARRPLGAAPTAGFAPVATGIVVGIQVAAATTAAFFQAVVTLALGVA